ncbi:MAG: hypothetical protein PUF04_09345 [bacterium]|nr:hypothetical protein [bacterium]
MATKRIDARVQNKRDLEANWIAENPVFLDGELIFVDLKNGDVGKKVGDGTTRYDELPLELAVSAEEKARWDAKSDFSGRYEDLIDAPEIPSVDGLATEEYVENLYLNAQSVIDLQGMAVFEGDGAARVAVEYQDYAPAYSGLVNLTDSTVLSELHYGRFMTVTSSSASTITLPAIPATYNEMELINLGTGEVTISGLMQNGTTGIVLRQGNAVTMKSCGSYWCVIGEYKEV